MTPVLWHWQGHSRVKLPLHRSPESPRFFGDHCSHCLAEVNVESVHWNDCHCSYCSNSIIYHTLLWLLLAGLKEHIGSRAGLWERRPQRRAMRKRTSFTQLHPRACDLLAQHEQGCKWLPSRSTYVVHVSVLWRYCVGTLLGTLLLVRRPMRSPGP